MTRARSGKTMTQGRKRTRRLTKGFVMSRHNLYRQSIVTLIRGRKFAFRDRRVRKRDFRSLWISRINAAVRREGLSYSVFMHGLKKSGVSLNRKALADLAVSDQKAFGTLLDLARQASQK